MDRLSLFIEGREWRFAKTYAETAPHEYTIRTKYDKEFSYAVQFIRDNGYQKLFWGKPYTYFDLDGYSYWTMGDLVEETTVLNRAKL